MITVHPDRSTHTHRHTCRHSLPGLRSRGPDKTGDGGDSSEDSDAGALHLLTDSYAWRSLKAPPSHNLPVRGTQHTHTHTQIDRHTHTQMPTFIQTHTDPRCTYTSCSSCCLLLTYLPPLFSSSHPFPRAPFDSTPSISCYLSSFLTSSSPSSSPPPPNCRMHEPTYTHTPTHTLTCQVPSVRGRVEET